MQGGNYGYTTFRVAVEVNVKQLGDMSGVTHNQGFCLIGIDTGVHTGFAVWDSGSKRLTEVSTYTITQAMERVKMIADVRGRDDVRLYIEDARQRTWFGHTGRERLKGAGSVCRDAKIWQDWCAEQNIECIMVAPKHNRTKLSAAQFRVLTKWTGRTTEHGRDAAMLVFGR